MAAPGIPRQAWCCLCGATGAIDMHHVIPRSRGGHKGPQVPLCHECHMAHHDGRRRLTFEYDGERWYGGRPPAYWRPLHTDTEQ